MLCIHYLLQSLKMCSIIPDNFLATILLTKSTSIIYIYIHIHYIHFNLYHGMHSKNFMDGQISLMIQLHSNLMI